jgi:hypothetical protein
LSDPSTVMLLPNFVVIVVLLSIWTITYAGDGMPVDCQ